LTIYEEKSMTKTTRKYAAALVGTAALIAGASAVASAESGEHHKSTTHQTAPHQHDSYGRIKVRSGIPAAAYVFTLTSPDLSETHKIPANAWANGFGCTGGNKQIRLKWSGAPRTARSYAVSMQDVDTTTGSGFWHWMTWDIPASQHSLGRTLPSGAVAGTNDAGAPGYLGPCPPAGDITHHYKITVYALDTANLKLNAATTPAVAAVTMSNHIVGYGRITATAHR